VPPFNLLSDADIVALSIVKEGANRKRIFLRKQRDNEDLLTLPAQHRIVKSDDWEAVYCVVAEPGAQEDPGIADGRGSGIPDVWASEDEIRKAAWRFAENGALVNKMHESLEPYGKVVENAVALSDFTVGEETIRKGSWYVAIKPSPEGREAIEKGEFTGVSIQGTALRHLVEDKEPVTVLQKIRDLVGLPAETATLESTSQEDDADMDLTQIENKVDEISKAQGPLTEAVNGLVGTVNNLVERLDGRIKAAEEAEAKRDEGEGAPSPKELKKALDDLTGDLADKLDNIEKGIDALAAGDSSQDKDPDNVEKSKADPLYSILG
jgi:hypothetical protein